MKKTVSLMIMMLLCSCSKYQMQDLPEPVRDEFTENINFYIYRAKGNDEEFKKVFKIANEVDVSLDDFRVIYLSKNEKANPKLRCLMLYLIDHKEHPANYLNKEVTNNPWAKELSNLLGKEVLAINNLNNDETLETTFNFCGGCNIISGITKVDINNVYYFGDATDEEIENYFKSLHLNFNLSGKHTLQYYPKWNMDHSYLINDVNVYMENKEGILERK